MRIAVFGAGGITSRAYLPILLSRPEIQIIGVFSRTQESVDKICKEFQINYGTTEAQNLIEIKPDAAFVLTNNQTHFNFTEL